MTRRFIWFDESGTVAGVATGVPIIGKVSVPGEWVAEDDPRVVAYLSPPTPPRRLSAYRIVRRVEEAGKLEAAAAILDANPALKWRFITAGGILVDDPDLIAGLRALGLDPDAVLAPEE